MADLLAQKVAEPDVVHTTGFARLDDVTGGFRAGQVWLVASAPGDGRSMLLLQWALRLARHGAVTSLTSPRQPMWDLRARVLAHVARVSVHEVRSGEGRVELVEDAWAGLPTVPLSVHPSVGAAAGVSPEVLVIDDADLASSPEQVCTSAHDGALVIVSLPLDRMLTDAGLDPAWSRPADVIVQVDSRAWSDRDFSEPISLRMLKHRWGPLVDQPVWFEPAFARLRDASDHQPRGEPHEAALCAHRGRRR